MVTTRFKGRCVRARSSYTTGDIEDDAIEIAPSDPTKPCSSKLGRKPSLTINQDTCSRPPWKSSVKNEGSKTITDNKNKRTTTHSRHTLPKKNTRENVSPMYYLRVDWIPSK